MRKKYLKLVASSLALSMIASPTYAALGQETNQVVSQSAPTFNVELVDSSVQNLEQGDTFIVKITLDNFSQTDPFLASDLTIGFPSNVFEYVNVGPQPAFPLMSEIGNMNFLTYPNFNMELTSYNANLVSDDKVKISWAGTNGVTPSATTNNNFALLKFKVKDNVVSGQYGISLLDDINVSDDFSASLVSGTDISTIAVRNPLTVNVQGTVDTIPPAPVSNITSTKTYNSVTLSWDANQETDFAKYRVYKDGELVNETTDTSFEVGGLNPDTSYEFKVTAVDSNNNESTGEPIAVITNPAPDTTAPAPVSNITSTKTYNSVTLSWDANQETDFAKYKVYKDGELVNETTDTSFEVGGLDPDTSYQFKVTAVDSNNNESTGEVVTVVTNPVPDTTAPTTVTGLVYNNLTSNSVTLSWAANTDSDLSKYNIYKDGAFLDKTTDTSFNVTGLNSNTSYEFAVSAVDQKGNESALTSLDIKTKSSYGDGTLPGTIDELKEELKNFARMVNEDYDLTPEQEADLDALAELIDDPVFKSKVNQTVRDAVYLDGEVEPNDKVDLTTDLITLAHKAIAVGKTKNEAEIEQFVNELERDLTDLAADHHISVVDVKNFIIAYYANIKTSVATDELNTDNIVQAFADTIEDLKSSSDPILADEVADNTFYGIGVDDVRNVISAFREKLYNNNEDSPFKDEKEILLNGWDILKKEFKKYASQQPAPTDPAPAAVDSFTAETPTTNSVTLNWTKSGENDFKQYVLYNDTQVIATITDVNTTSYTVDGLTPDSNYLFKIKVVDLADQESSAASVNVKTAAEQGPTDPAPAAVTNFAAGTPTTNSVTLSWTKNEETDFKQYVIYNGTQVVTTITNANTTSYTVSGLAASTNYVFSIKVVDLANQESSAATVNVKTADATGGGGNTGGGGTGTTTPPANTGNVGGKVSDTIKDAVKDGTINPGNVSDIVKDIKEQLKGGTAEDAKSALSAVAEQAKASTGDTQKALGKVVSAIAAEYVKKAAQEELSATKENGQAKATATGAQLKSVVEKAAEALKEAKSQLDAAGVKDATLRAYLTLSVPDAAEETVVNFSISDLQSAMTGLGKDDTEVKVVSNGVSVSINVSDILQALTAKASLGAAAANDDYSIQIVKSGTPQTATGLQNIAGVEVVELKVSSKDKTVTKFIKPVTVEIEVDLPKGTDQEKVVAYKQVDGKWIPVGGIYEDGIVTFTTNELGKYTVFVSTKTFTDISSVSWAQQQIEVMAAKGIINGRSETKFAPYANVTRAEFASLLVRALGLYDANTTAQFNDVKSSDWFSASVGSAVKAGIVQGVSADQFKPNAAITRQEMAVMLSNALKLNGASAENVETTLAAFSDSSNIQSWAKEGVALAAQFKLVQGLPNKSFAPNEKATRAQAAVVIYNLLKQQ